MISAGDVVLKDLKLKAEALNALKLPVTVKAGFVGTITLKVAIAFTIGGCPLPTFESLPLVCQSKIWIHASLCVLLHI